MYIKNDYFIFSGRASKMSLKDANAQLNKTYGDIVAIKGTMGRSDMIITYNPNDFEQVIFR